MNKTTLHPTHPGKILLTGIKDHGLSVSKVARDTGIPVSTLNAIVRGMRPIGAENALRIGRYFKTSAKFWVNMQADYDLRIASMKSSSEVEESVLPFAV